MTGMLELAARVEAATGPSRELDALIDAAVHDRRLWANPALTVPAGEADYYEKPAHYHESDVDLLEGVPLMERDHPEGEWKPGPNGRAVLKNPNRRAPAKFTASLDAALTLVPEDRFVGALNQCDVGGEWYARIEAHQAVYEDATAATPALALCAAALRSIASMREGGV